MLVAKYNNVLALTAVIDKNTKSTKQQIRR